MRLILEAIIYSANDAIDIEGHEARGDSRSGPGGKSRDRNGGEIDDLRQKSEVIVFDETRPVLVERAFETGADSPAVPGCRTGPVGGRRRARGRGLAGGVVALHVVVLTSVSPSCSTATPALP